ncbi:DUF3826 domain-containing protein [Puia sp. P3]|uniref:DUF3826 domain-containing protein n=1 Tax=Puia sp. P3 TaxID=3423952 RepID=UPI003D676692
MTAGVKAQKAAEWVGSLKLGDTAKENRLTAVLEQHLRAVKMYNDEHVPMPKSAHDSLMNGLRKDLPDSQVNKILDKYTVGKVDFTLRGYKAIVPDLTPQEESVIRKNLEKAREEAMDVKNMKQISAVFEIYKTKNEQYLNSNGRNWHELFKAYVNEVKRKKVIVAEEFLYDTAAFPECHAATIAETPGDWWRRILGGLRSGIRMCVFMSAGRRRGRRCGRRR